MHNAVGQVVFWRDAVWLVRNWPGMSGSNHKATLESLESGTDNAEIAEAPIGELKYFVSCKSCGQGFPWLPDDELPKEE